MRLVAVYTIEVNCLYKLIDCDAPKALRIRPVAAY